MSKIDLLLTFRRIKANRDSMDSNVNWKLNDLIVVCKNLKKQFHIFWGKDKKFYLK